MNLPAPKPIPPRPAFPWLTAAVLLAAIGTSVFPGIADSAVGERSVLDHAELWRAWTAHLVHFSASHLASSGLLWVVAGSFVERSSRASLVALLALGSPLITGAALAGDAGLARFGGLSGLASGALTWLAMDSVARHAGPRRWAGLGILVSLLAKLAWEFTSGHGSAPLVATFSADVGPVRVATFAHLAGVALGATIYALQRRKINRADDREERISANAVGSRQSSPP